MCIWAILLRLVENVNLRAFNVMLQFGKIAKGLYQKPFVIDFSAWLKQLSHDAVDIDAYNAYTVGNWSQIDGAPWWRPWSNFHNPRCRFKDTWFGCYIVLDDARGRGRRFMLTQPEGDPADLANLNPFSIKLLPELDQKLIVFSTHDQQPDYTLEKFEKDFYFRLKPGTGLDLQHVDDPHGRTWLRVLATYETLAAVADLNVTKPRIFDSIRAYTGLPDDRIYRDIKPWHPVDLRGCCWVRYFGSGYGGFWATVYCNGSSFKLRDGSTVDTWTQFDLQSVFQKMFDDLEIDVVKK